ncbi:MAG: hypothetical protein RIR79_1045 [Pseudomonadota bacterium]|jgi:adenine-specific DNA-methyltransferase
MCGCGLRTPNKQIEKNKFPYMTDPIFTTPMPNIQKLEALRQLFPQAIETDTDGRIRINAAALQIAIDPANPAGVQVEEDGFEMRWVGKREAYHSAFVPVQKILAPLPDESKNWDNTNNILIKGDNIDALRLLRQSYFGKIKLIYIDPPYNTQSDAFIYRDDFTAKQNEILTQLGYAKENIDYIQNIYSARTHSGWLSFMYPRLLLAKDLLRDDGVIFISIDDNEQAQLKLLCDEIFGQENFVANFIWQHRKSSQNDVDISLSHNYILTYAKNRALCEFNSLSINELKFTNPDNDPRGDWAADPMDAPGIRENLSYAIKNPQTGDIFYPPNARHWRFTEEKFLQAIADNRIVFGKKGKSKPQFKRFKSEAHEKGVSPFTIWTDWGTATDGTKELLEIFEGSKIFETPKPVRLMAEIAKLAAEKDSIVLDFFAGSGTTAEAVMRLNAEDGGTRQFILVQIPQPIDAKKQKEAHHFVTHTLGKSEATIFEITAERIRRAGSKIDSTTRITGALDTGFRVFELVDDPEALLLQKPLQETTQEDWQAFQTTIATPQIEQRPRVLYNLLLAEGLPLTAPMVEVIPDHLYRAANVLFILHAMPLDIFSDILRELKNNKNNNETPVNYLTIYAPWVADDNFMLGIQTVAETLGFPADKVRVRG